MNRKYMLLLSAASAGLFATASPALADDAPGATAARDEIVVTARRRSESLQDVPVAVAALSAAAIEARGIHSEADLQLAIPGLMVLSANNNNEINYVMRGEAVDAYSGSPPGVQPYIDEVPLPMMSSTAFYDLENVQAVKGPQGTLFGRNSTGGAVLFQTHKPTSDFGGYGSIQYGNLNRLIAEAAVNLPLADIAALRVAGTATSGGAYVRNLYDNALLGDNQERSLRATLDLHLSPEISNETMVQIGKATGTNVPNTMYYAIPCGQPSGFNSCTYSPSNQPFFNNLLSGATFAGYPGGYVYPGGFQNLPAFLASKGPYVIDANVSFTHDSSSELVINKTEWQASPLLTIKNVFGYSHSKNAIGYDTDFSPYPIIQQYAPGAAITGAPQPVETAKMTTWSDELQFQGKTGDGRLTYLVGLFYNSYAEDYYSPLWIGAFNASVAYNALTNNKSYAVFAQATYKLADNLNLTVGGRYTWEKIRMRQLAQSLFGAGNPQSAEQSDPSWTASLDYHLSREIMVYATTRGSWRRGGFNWANPPTPTPLTAAQGGGGNYFLPERVRDVEGGIKYDGRMGEMPVTANLAIYNSWVSNIQKTAYTVIAGTASSATINVPKTRIFGIEADLAIRPAEGLRLGATMAYTDAKFTHASTLLFGSPVTYGPFGDVPKFSGTLYGDYSMDLPGKTGTLGFHVDVYHQSSFYFSNLAGTLQPGTLIPAYTLVNARLDWGNMFGSRVKGSLFVKNLGDKLYYTGGEAGAQNFSMESATFGSPRTYGAVLRIDF
ncbi:MAG: TonB-dependent receptor [Sphingomonadales bacterium]|nr:TonB-dependent receptor [Sphingomonadales bacterium]